MISTRSDSNVNSSFRSAIVSGREGIKIIFICAILLVTRSLLAQTPEHRPRVLGIAHIAFDVGDLTKTRAFYENVLGFEQAFSLARPDGTEWIGFIKVNDRQYVELFAAGSQFAGELDHLALYTDDAAGMRAYVTARGIPLVDELHTGRTGDEYFSIRDPDGHLIEIVQYKPHSWSAREAGNLMRPDRISDHISHAGIVVRSMAASLRFYHDVLGFQEFAQDMTSGPAPKWASVRVADGTDYLALVSPPAPVSPSQRRAETYVGFASGDLPRTVTDLKARTSSGSPVRPIDVQTGIGNHPQASLFDPDSIRIDFTGPAPAPASH
jgi:catechol 2,3-dioxygenase-like lactoylglutathione lyase family enzyme